MTNDLSAVLSIGDRVRIGDPMFGEIYRVRAQPTSSIVMLADDSESRELKPSTYDRPDGPKGRPFATMYVEEKTIDLAMESSAEVVRSALM